MPLKRTPPKVPMASPKKKAETTRATKRPAIGSPEVTASVTLSEDCPVTPNQLKMIVEEIVSKHSTELKQQMYSMFKEMINTETKSLREDLQELKEAVNYTSNQYDQLLSEQRVATERIRELESTTQSLSKSLSDITKRVNQIEQQSRSSNVEIQCVPEKKTENLTAIVTKLSEIVKCPSITSQNIHHCTRIAKLDPTSKRPRSIIVQLSSPRVRDDFLAAIIRFNRARKKNDKLNASHLNLGDSNEPIYVIEHLSPLNKDLHAAARQKKKEKAYQFLWDKATLDNLE
ncbi:hypothetical protein ACJJTC_001893 [Scirpophaga incertulas]